MLGKQSSLKVSALRKFFDILPFNHHLGQTDSVGLRHKLLPEQAHIGAGIVMLDKAVRRAEHTARSAGLVADSYNLANIENVVTALADKDSDKTLDNIAARVKLTGIYILIELANQMLEDIAHLDAVVGLGVQIQVGKCLHHAEQTAVLIHLVDMAEHFKSIEDFLHFGGEALNIHFEIGFNVVRLVAQVLSACRARCYRTDIRKCGTLPSADSSGSWRTYR